MRGSSGKGQVVVSVWVAAQLRSGTVCGSSSWPCSCSKESACAACSQTDWLSSRDTSTCKDHNYASIPRTNQHTTVDSGPSSCELRMVEVLM